MKRGQIGHRREGDHGRGAGQLPPGFVLARRELIIPPGATEAQLRQLAQLFRQADESLNWGKGDFVLFLQEQGFKKIYASLAETKKKQAYLRRLRQVAKRFPPAFRVVDLPFTYYLILATRHKGYPSIRQAKSEEGREQMARMQAEAVGILRQAKEQGTSCDQLRAQLAPLSTGRRLAGTVSSPSLRRPSWVGWAPRLLSIALTFSIGAFATATLGHHWRKDKDVHRELAVARLQSRAAPAAAPLAKLVIAARPEPPARMVREEPPSLVTITPYDEANHQVRGSWRQVEPKLEPIRPITFLTVRRPVRKVPRENH